MSFENGHALIIGIGTYDESRLTAPSTAADAVAIAAALRDDEVAGYPKDNVVLLSDADATVARIGEELDKLAARATADATVIVFYAGHGLVGSSGEYFLTARDTKIVPGTVTLVESTALPESSLLTKLRAIKAGKVLVLINACFSGNVDSLGLDDDDGTDDESLGPPPSENLALRVLGSGEGRAVITACRADQKSWLRRPDPTFFGNAIAEALRGRGSNQGSKFVGLFELYTYVFETTKTHAAGLSTPRVQEPVLRISEAVGPFPVALVPRDGGALGLDEGDPDIAQDLPDGAEAVPSAQIKAVSKLAPGVDLSHSTFKIMNITGVDGSVIVGDVVFGDQTTITIGVGAQPAAAAAVASREDLGRSIDAVAKDLGTIKAGVADRRDLRDGLEDVETELARAQKALSESDRDYAITKLDDARAKLAKLGPKVPAAVPLSDTVSVLAQRARTAQ